VIKKISLFCLIAILLSAIYFNEGCNVFKPAPTPTAIPTPIPIFTPTPSIPESYVSSAKEAIESLETLQTITKMDISNENYNTKLIDTKIVVDKFLRDNKTEYIKSDYTSLNKEIKLAMMFFEDYSVWGTETIRAENSHKVEKPYTAFKRIFYYLLLSQKVRLL
jgi:hypothetical protein